MIGGIDILTSVVNSIRCIDYSGVFLWERKNRFENTHPRQDNEGIMETGSYSILEEAPRTRQYTCYFAQQREREAT